MKDNIENINAENMKEQIRLRMENDIWDLKIARKVMETKNSRSEKIISTWSFASLATAAMSFIIFMASIYTAGLQNNTYSNTGSIYSYAYITNDNNLDNDVVASKLELTINEAFPMR